MISWSALLLPALLVILPVAPAQAAPSVEQQLADKYAPIVVIREHSTECGDGEPYIPIPVDAVLGRPKVVLRNAQDEAVMSAPTVQDLQGKGEGYYLDMPGDPLAPGCDYERWANKLGASPTIYARVVQEAGQPDKTVLQYWFFWAFNDWNDKHEGDWEMIQLQFDASNPEQALVTDPLTVAFAQHEGSEVSGWNDPKLIRQGEHPVVYPGQGSHAAYFTQSRWFGKSAAAGFGCDETQAMGEEIQPEVVLMPSRGTAEFGWLDYTGRWGQKEPSFNNGPTGPNTKTQWSQPVTWQREEGRTSAVAIPALPGPALDAFCSLTAGGSLLFIKLLRTPWAVLGLLAVVIGLVIAGARATRWRGSDIAPLVARRQAGQIVASAFGAYRRGWRTTAPLTAVLLGSFMVVGLVQSWLLERGDGGPITDVFGSTAVAPRLLATLIQVLVLVPVVLAVLAVAMSMTRLWGEGQAHGLAAAASAARVRGALSFLVLLATVSALTGSLVLLPVGLWLAARWAVAPPAAAAGSDRLGLSRSARLTQGRRWRSLGVALILVTLPTAASGVLGTLLLLLTNSEFLTVTAITALVGSALAVVAAIGFVLHHFDLELRSGEASTTE